MMPPLALDVLQEELENFTDKGLARLLKDLKSPKSKRPGYRSWKDNPLSYRKGRVGSVKSDICGSVYNMFICHWDDGRVDENDLLEEVEREIKKRTKAKERLQ